VRIGACSAASAEDSLAGAAFPLWVEDCKTLAAETAARAIFCSAFEYVDAFTQFDAPVHANTALSALLIRARSAVFTVF